MRTPPTLLRVYIALTGVTAIAVIGGLLVTAPAVASARDLLIAVQVVVLVALARIYPVHLAPKSKLTLDTAPTLAALVLLPPAAAILSVGAGMLAGELWQRAPGFQTRFNTSVAVLCTTAGVVVVQTIAHGVGTAPGARDVVALAVALVTMIVASALLVDVALGLATGRPLPVAHVWSRHSGTLGAEAGLAVLGVAAAYVAVDLPWVLVLMAVPGALIFISLRDGVALRRRTITTLTQLADLAGGCPDTGAAHGERVADLCIALAQRVPPGNIEFDALRTAARLHQLTALKGGALDVEQMAITAHLVGGDAATEILRHQLERWDGTGPYGLAGERIPFGARILAVADAYDHITGSAASSVEPEVALAMLTTDRGRRFDPATLDSLASVIGDIPLPARASIASQANAAV